MDRKLVVRAFNANHKHRTIGRIPAQNQISGDNTGSKHHPVDVARKTEVDDGVRPITEIEAVGVRSDTSLEDIVSTRTGQIIITERASNDSGCSIAHMCKRRKDALRNRRNYLAL